MEELDRKQLLEQLYRQQFESIIRLKHLRSAIVGLGGKVSPSDLSELLYVEGAVRAKKLPIEIPETYHGELRQIQKIGFVIRLLGGEATVAEIVEKMIELTPRGLSDDQKIILRRNIAMLTSYLQKDGRLSAEKVDGRLKYKLV